MKFLVPIALILGLLAPSWAQDDLVSRVVQPQNPQTPSAFMATLRESGFEINLHTVANRGACNTNSGSFSIFGDVGPDLSFGVFVEANQRDELTLQEGFDTRLLVEVIAKDQTTGLKNFWELIGEKTHAKWYYRGNSLDVLADIETINMGPKTQAVFGKRLRCSGCHTGGDLVMKELFPYNDWRVDELPARPKHHLSPKVQTLFEQVRSAHHLAELVTTSLRDYVKVLEEKSPESTAQWMRSVLAPLEMNLASDIVPFKERLRTGQDVEIPSAFFVDPLLTGAQEPIRVPVKVYEKALEEVGSSFAANETPGLSETQHAFLVPVRSRFDRLRVESMVERGLLDAELLADFLAVDWQKNLYSSWRLQLMSFIPKQWETSQELQRLLEEKSRDKKLSLAAFELMHNIDAPSRTADFHRAKALVYLAELRAEAKDKERVKGWLRMARQRRQEIQDAETSSNPRGSILEGGLGESGFRRIFPQYTKL